MTDQRDSGDETLYLEEQRYNLPFLYTEAEKIDKPKAVEIGASYAKLEILFTEACNQLQAIVEGGVDAISKTERKRRASK